jgi:hypothetical protein
MTTNIRTSNKIGIPAVTLCISGSNGWLMFNWTETDMVNLIIRRFTSSPLKILKTNFKDD